MTVSLAKKMELFYNSPDRDAFIEEYNRDCRIRRVENKAFENRDKRHLISLDVLDEDDFIFEPFFQERGEGDSGSLYMATHKKHSYQQYIVKHAYCHCAANEYVYSKILKVLGLKTPEVKLFRLSDPTDGTLFKTEYVVGIEYLEFSKPRPSREAIRAAKNADDFYSFLTLENILHDADGHEFVLTYDGYIYRIDMADSFKVADYMLISAGLDKSDKREFNARALADIGSLKHMDSCMENWFEIVGKDKASALLKPLVGIQKIRKPYINEFLETLRYFYPDCVCDYYGSYISALQRTARRYTSLIAGVKAQPVSAKQKTG